MSHMITAEPSAVAAAEKEQDAGISGFAAAECVTQGVLTCINDKSFYWPKCDPAQAKNIVGASGYEFGYYCTSAWAASLNQMLSDRAVNKCPGSLGDRLFFHFVPTSRWRRWSDPYDP
ncbi:unnamed protein product [Polarella glacialis]|uniref:Uncharacterized protein n=1 Tax=Polarella glacialis TaxID=89957 RepID=A0A813HYY6_POLGL|nr:unnamed protein product [Polarella glacialis]